MYAALYQPVPEASSSSHLSTDDASSLYAVHPRATSIALYAIDPALFASNTESGLNSPFTDIVRSSLPAADSAGPIRVSLTTTGSAVIQHQMAQVVPSGHAIGLLDPSTSTPVDPVSTTLDKRGTKNARVMISNLI